MFFSLLLFLLITIYRYNKNLFLLALISLSLLYTLFDYKQKLNLFNFVMLNYIFLSIYEYLTHKYIMHFNKDSYLSKMMKHIPYLNKLYFKIGNNHIKHHMSVEPDMKLKGGVIEYSTHNDGLFSNWDEFVPLTFTSLIGMIGIKMITNYDISLINMFIMSMIITYSWSYLWNKIHPQMHNHDIKFTIKDGPYDNGLFDLSFMKNILLDNHKIHHMRKGDNRGNYNVILLGADEWFNRNNKSIDNIEFCIKNPTNKICQ